jgi:hypothetical protein
MFRSKFDQNTWTFISVWYSPSLRMLGFVRWKLKINTPNWNCKGVCQVRSICQLLVEPLLQYCNALRIMNYACFSMSRAGPATVWIAYV